MKAPHLCGETKAARRSAPVSQPKPLYRMFANLSKPQAEILAAFSFGAAKAKSCALNAVARELTFLGIPDTAAPFHLQ